ncbi:HNH endonuclease family protein [Larsenimonas suaedae]
MKQGEEAYERARDDYLYSGMTSRLTLGNDTNNIFLDLLQTGRANTAPRSPHESRLMCACNHFQAHIDAKQREGRGTDYLKRLFRTITQKLHFTFYRIEEAHEVGMTFELMNSRGKELSALELLKNYLMYWVSRNVATEWERRDITARINKAWKNVYTNLAAWDGDAHENQCLRVAWTLYCAHTPKYWKGYEGFKSDEYLPLRNFSGARTKEATKGFLIRFVDGLAEVSGLYASVMLPSADSRLPKQAAHWFTKLHRTKNLANFLPLMVAARRAFHVGEVTESDYVAHLEALECYAYRVFLYEEKRSNAGKSMFYRLGNEVFKGNQTLESATVAVHALIRYYSPEKSFQATLQLPDDWYYSRHCLKYTLYEYELHLLSTEGQGRAPKLAWSDLVDSTIEHILPQQPKESSRWLKDWNPGQIEHCLHNIGNLVLTQNNSAYSNFEFVRKRGMVGESPSYANSDIRQERRVARFNVWTYDEFAQRRVEIATWIGERWSSQEAKVVDASEVDEDSDADEYAEALVEGVS